MSWCGPAIASYAGMSDASSHSTASRPTSEPRDAERLTGHGAVYRGGLKVRETEYDLTVTPAAQRDATFEAGNEPKGSPDITGRLVGPLYDAESLEGVHTLVLEDGRAFDFRVIQPDTNEIIGVTWFEQTSQPRHVGR